MKNTILIKELREATKLTEEQCSDKKLLEITKGTLMRSAIETTIAMKDFNKATKGILPKRTLLLDIIIIVLLLIFCIVIVLNIN